MQGDIIHEIFHIVFYSQNYKLAYEIVSILSEDLFPNPTHKFLFQKAKHFFLKERKQPSTGEMLFLIDSLKDEILKADAKKQYVSYKISNGFSQNVLVNFLNVQKIKNGIILASKKISSFDSFEDETQIAEIAREIRESSIPITLHEDLVEVKQDPNIFSGSRKTIPTKWKVINELSNGGIGKKELTVFAGTSGGGKTWVLCNIGVSAVEKNYNVLHLTLELSKEYTARRYASIIKEKPFDKFTPEEKKSAFDGEIFKGNLYICEFASYSLTIEKVSALLEKNSDKKIDLVLLDYADLMKPSNMKQSLWEQLNEIYYNLRKMASEYDVAMVTASQTNRESRQKDFIDADSLAGSFGKNAVADLLISFSRNKQNNTAKFFVVKNRFGNDGISLNAFFDASNGKISIQENSFEV